MKNSMRKKCPYQICEKLSSIFRYSSSINHPWDFHRYITICNFRRCDDIMQLSLQKSGIFRDIGEKKIVHDPYLKKMIAYDRTCTKPYTF